MASSRRWATSSMSSRRTTAKVEAVNPCLRELRAERALPSGERGPVEWAALARLAASCLWDTGCFIRVPFDLSYSMGRGWSLKLKLGQVMGGKGDKVLGVEVNGSGTSTQRDGKPEERMPPGMGAWQPKRPLHGELERDPARSWCVTGGCCANRIAGRW